MPQWVNIKDRLPIKQVRQYVKIGGRKDVMDYERLEQYREYSDDCFWLDEEMESGAVKLKWIPNNFGTPTPIGKKIKLQSAIENINNGVYETNIISVVEKLFGLKRSKRLKQKSWL